ncbi:hypothetical protein Tco_0855090 [Tanacetum coccineum]
MCIGFCSGGGGGGGSVDVVSVVSVTLEGTSADAVRALKIWCLRVSEAKLFIPSRGSRNLKRSLGKAFVRILVCFHEVEFNHSIFHLLSNEMVSYVYVLRS